MVVPYGIRLYLIALFNSLKKHHRYASETRRYNPEFAETHGAVDEKVCVPSYILNYSYRVVVVCRLFLDISLSIVPDYPVGSPI